MNWRGRPLTSHEVIVQSIAATTTRTGLRVHAELDTDTHPIGIYIHKRVVSECSMTPAPEHRHCGHPEWGYTIRPFEFF